MIALLFPCLLCFVRASSRLVRFAACHPSRPQYTKHFVPFSLLLVDRFMLLPVARRCISAHSCALLNPISRLACEACILSPMFLSNRHRVAVSLLGFEAVHGNWWWRRGQWPPCEHFDTVIHQTAAWCLLPAGSSLAFGSAVKKSLLPLTGSSPSSSHRRLGQHAFSYCLANHSSVLRSAIATAVATLQLSVHRLPRIPARPVEPAVF